MDEETKQTNTDNEDDAEDDNDTRLSGSEVLSLHELGGNIPGGNELLVDGGHCV